MAIPLWVSLAILQFFVLGVFTLYMVRHYASKNAPRFSLIIVFISWYVATLFMIISQNSYTFPLEFIKSTWFLVIVSQYTRFRDNVLLPTVSQYFTLFMEHTKCAVFFMCKLFLDMWFLRFGVESSILDL